MSCFLFDSIVFGPVNSRRLGISLGINLLPVSKKVCSFNCIYCECGWTKTGDHELKTIAPKEEVLREVEKALLYYKNSGEPLQTLTFGGNGEPTLHPDFHELVTRVSALRNAIRPDVKLSVLSNASTLDRPLVLKALMLTDNPILKLDAGTEETFRHINKPRPGLTLELIVSQLASSGISHMIIQTMFLKGEANGVTVDNTTDTEVNLWLAHLQRIRPQSVMLYSIARETPEQNLIKIDKTFLDGIANKVKALNIPCETY